MSLKRWHWGMVAGSALAAMAVAAAAEGGLDQKPRQTAQSAYALHFDDRGDSAALAFGAAKSDAVALMLECDKGSGVVRLSDAARGPEAALVLASGSDRTSVPAAFEDSPAGPIVGGELPLTSPPLAAFRASGRITVGQGAQAYEVAAGPEERARLAAFFASCEGSAGLAA
jgi:hypothetical protein